VCLEEKPSVVTSILSCAKKVQRVGWHGSGLVKQILGVEGDAEAVPGTAARTPIRRFEVRKRLGSLALTSERFPTLACRLKSFEEYFVQSSSTLRVRQDTKLNSGLEAAITGDRWAARHRYGTAP
jgi:hypothetical protein